MRSPLKIAGIFEPRDQELPAHALAEFGITRFADATEAVYRDLLVNR